MSNKISYTINENYHKYGDSITDPVPYYYQTIPYNPIYKPPPLDLNRVSSNNTAAEIFTVENNKLIQPYGGYRILSDASIPSKLKTNDTISVLYSDRNFSGASKIIDPQNLVDFRRLIWAPRSYQLFYNGIILFTYQQYVTPNDSEFLNITEYSVPMDFCRIIRSIIVGTKNNYLVKCKCGFNNLIEKNQHIPFFKCKYCKGNNMIKIEIV